MKRFFRYAAILAIAGAIGGFLVSAAGVVPIKASSGHFAPTTWFLQFSKRRSVATHTLLLRLPPLEDPALVLRGAGHYETGCQPCHGSPELPHPRVPAAMLPPPPYLPPAVPRWEPEELFYIVKHGIKFTGMPAWPAQTRDDEVRAMVAFLLEMPRLDAAGYRRLVHGEAPAEDGVAPLVEMRPTAAAARCVRCHGPDGRGRGNAAFPALAGQHPEYLRRALDAYARGDRHSGIMEPIAAALEPAEREEIAAYYARLPPLPPRPAEDAAAIERGRRIAMEGIHARRVPACSDCHGPSPRHANPAYPMLAGQYPEYLELQLQLFHSGARGGSAFAHLMDPVAGRLEPGEMRDVALYYASIDAHAHGHRQGH